VLAEHTYDHRAKLVEAVLENAVGSAPRTAVATVGGSYKGLRSTACQP
jgi:hypothetical protein